MRWIALFALLTAACATSKGVKEAYSEPLSTKENALLWKVSGNGLSSPSFLYGTIHMICREDFLFSDTLKQKFTDAQHVYLELDLDDPSLMVKMASMAIMKDKSLKQLMGEDDYAFLSNYVKDSLGLPMLMVNRMKPITLMSLLYSKMLPCKNNESYEMKFVELAKAAKKEIRGLETVEDQMSVFDKIPDSIEAKMILDMIRTMPEQRRQLTEMVEAYKNQNLNLLAEKMSDAPEWKGFEEVLLVNRNRNWIGKMAAAMKEGSQLFAVGAGHLPGKEGVIQLLRNSGYSVVPVKQ